MDHLSTSAPRPDGHSFAFRGLAATLERGTASARRWLSPGLSAIYSHIRESTHFQGRNTLPSPPGSHPICLCFLAIQIRHRQVAPRLAGFHVLKRKRKCSPRWGQEHAQGQCEGAKSEESGVSVPGSKSQSQHLAPVRLHEVI